VTSATIAVSTVAVQAVVHSKLIACHNNVYVYECGFIIFSGYWLATALCMINKSNILSSSLSLYPDIVS